MNWARRWFPKPLLLILGGYLCGGLWGVTKTGDFRLPEWCWWFSIAGMAALGWWGGLLDPIESREDR